MDRHFELSFEFGRFKSIGIRLLICTKFLASSKKSISTSSCLASKIYRSTHERPLISNFKVKDKILRMENAQVEDIPMLIDFVSQIAAKHKPPAISLGVKPSEFRPFVEKNIAKGIRYTMIFMDKDRVFAGGIGHIRKLDRSKAVEPKVLKDYGEIIDSLKNWIPSRKMRRVVATTSQCSKMITHFLSKDVNEIMSYDLCCAHKSVIGGHIAKKMIYELSVMAVRDGLKFAGTQTTACASYKTHTKNGSKEVFTIPYVNMFDHGKRIHPNVPLRDGCSGVRLIVLDLESLTKKAKC